MDEELKKTLKNLISNPLFELDCLLNEPSEDFLWFIAERSLEFINNSSDEGYKLSLFVFHSLKIFLSGYIQIHLYFLISTLRLIEASP